MTQSSVASPSTLEYASQSPRSHSNPSSPHHASARSVSTGMHHFEHIPGAYSSVIVVDPSMMPPGYMIGQVTTPRVEEPEEPLYVNAKQYHRILKRRAARANLEAQNRLMQRGRKFMHESRHLHAMRRPRGPGGRFLTAAEIAALDERESGGESSSSSSNHASNNNNNNNNNNSGDSHNNNSNGSHQGYSNGGNHGNGSGNNTSVYDGHYYRAPSMRQGPPDSAQAYKAAARADSSRIINADQH